MNVWGLSKARIFPPRLCLYFHILKKVCTWTLLSRMEVLSFLIYIDLIDIILYIDCVLQVECTWSMCFIISVHFLGCSKVGTPFSNNYIEHLHRFRPAPPDLSIHDPCDLHRSNHFYHQSLQATNHLILKD